MEEIRRYKRAQTLIFINGSTGPVQVTEGNSFSLEAEKYSDLIINAKISEEDIKFAIANLEDAKGEKSLLSKYGMDLTKIMVMLLVVL